MCFLNTEITGAKFVKAQCCTCHRRGRILNPEVCGSRKNEQQEFENAAGETIFSVEGQVSRQI